MSKKIGSLSKKHEFLIEKLIDIPTVEDIQNAGWSRDALFGKTENHRYNVEDILLLVLEKLTEGTQMEDIGKELSERARVIFDYCEESKI